MWGALVGLAGQAVSGIASVINNRRMQREADAEAARQRAYYEAKADENPLSRSENQHILGQYDRQSQQQIENARGVAAITGATPEYALGVQKAVAGGRADLMGSMAAGASQRADYYEAKGEQARHQKAIDDQERRAARNQTYANLAANAASAAGAIMDSYTAGLGKFNPNHSSIRGGNAAVDHMNEQAVSTGVQVGASPTTLAQEQAKIDSSLAALKKRLTPNG